MTSVVTSTGNYLRIRDYGTGLAGVYVPTATCQALPWDFSDQVLDPTTGVNVGGGTNRAEMLFFSKPSISIFPSINQTMTFSIYGQ